MLKTPLNEWHRANRGRMVDFAGWEMPVQYTSIVEEHCSVRQAAGVFDISHMGRMEFRGESAEGFLNFVLTNDVSQMRVGDVRYSLVCNHDGGILDDVLVYRFADRWELVVNASNREKLLAWFFGINGFRTFEFVDRTQNTGMIAVQGPAAKNLLSDLVPSVLDGTPIGDMKYYSAADAVVTGTWAESLPLIISRTGYTGEDGFEIVVPGAAAAVVWERLLIVGQQFGLIPAGLGCRDTLRLEAAMPLYGHELTESVDPLTAGLGFAVKFRKGDFIGRTPLEKIRSEGSRVRRVGLVLEGRRIAREQTSVFSGDREIGRVTSGTFSPTLQKSIAMAYVESEAGDSGTRVEVDLRGTRVSANIVELPFYRRTSGL